MCAATAAPLLLTVVALLGAGAGAGAAGAAFPGQNEKVAFAGERDGHSEIYVMNADGAELTRLTLKTITRMAPSAHLETTGGATNTWTNYLNAGGTAGQTIAANATVQIACKLTGWKTSNGNSWWYRVAQAPWNGQYYASADAFYNNGQTSGSLRGTPFVDPAVPDCGPSPGAGNSSKRRITPEVHFTATYTIATPVVFSHIRVGPVPAGARITFRCIRGCAQHETLAAGGAGTVVIPNLPRLRLTRTSAFTLTVTKPGFIGFYDRLVVIGLAGANPRAVTETKLCVPASGPKTPRACGSGG